MKVEIVYIIDGNIIWRDFVSADRQTSAIREIKSAGGIVSRTVYHRDSDDTLTIPACPSSERSFSLHV